MAQSRGQHFGNLADNLWDGLDSQAGRWKGVQDKGTVEFITWAIMLTWTLMSKSLTGLNKLS